MHSRRRRHAGRLLLPDSDRELRARAASEAVVYGQPEMLAPVVRKQQPGERVACVRALLLSARSGEIADDDEMLVLPGMQEPGVPGAALLSLLTSGTAGRPCRCCGAEHQFDERPRAVLLLVLFESQLYVVADLCFGAGASRDLANSCLDETVARAAERASRVGGLDG